jgi:hypothetical protein
MTPPVVFAARGFPAYGGIVPDFRRMQEQLLHA